MKTITRSRAGKLLLALTLLLPALTLQATPGSASTSYNAVGAASFEGTATLPKFPCAPPPTGTGCYGNFSGQWSGNLSGLYAGREFDISWRTLNNTGISANSFYYDEFTCVVPEAGSLLGRALGTGTARGGPGQVVGTMYGNNPNTLPVLIDEIQFDFTFEWTRVGNGAVIVLSPTSFRANVPTLGWVTLLNSRQIAVADFVPTGSSTPGGIPNCTTPLTNIHGAITGTVTFAHNP